MTNRELIRHIVRSDTYVEKWEKLNPIIFFKDNEPFGLIGISLYRDGVLISSCSVGNQKFTNQMIKHIISLANISKIYILYNADSQYVGSKIIKRFSKKFRIKTLSLERENVLIIKRKD